MYCHKYDRNHTLKNIRGRCNSANDGLIKKNLTITEIKL